VEKPDRRTHRIELLATVLLAVAALSTAWCSYQAARWNGEQAKQSGTTNRLRLEATRAQGLAEAESEVDVATFIAWTNAYARKEKELADFYFRRFRAEFRPAVRAWLATKPLQNAKAPLTPFALPQYRHAATVEAKRLDREAALSSASKDRDIQHATNYVLGVVLFASSLFFAGISTKLHSLRQREVLLAIGWAIYLCTAVWIATFPVNVSI